MLKEKQKLQIFPDINVFNIKKKKVNFADHPQKKLFTRPHIKPAGSTFTKKQLGLTYNNMNLLQATINHEDASGIILEHEEIINKLVQENIADIISVDNAIIQSNLENFVQEDNLLETYNNISFFVEHDIISFLDATSVILSDTDMSLEDKQEVLFDLDYSEEITTKELKAMSVAANKNFYQKRATMALRDASAKASSKAAVASKTAAAEAAANKGKILPKVQNLFGMKTQAEKNAALAKSKALQAHKTLLNSPNLVKSPYMHPKGATTFSKMATSKMATPKTLTTKANLSHVKALPQPAPVAMKAKVAGSGTKLAGVGGKLGAKANLSHPAHVAMKAKVAGLGTKLAGIGGKLGASGVGLKSAALGAGAIGLGGAALGYGAYKGAKALKNYLAKRKK